MFEFSAKCVDGLWARNTVAVTVLPLPAVALAGPDQTICTVGPVTLAGNTPGSGLTGTWTVSPTGGTFSPNANTPNATYTPAAGGGVRTLTWTISNGYCSVNDQMLLNVVVPAAVNAGTDQTRSCAGTTTTLAGSSPGLSPIQTGVWSVISGPNTPAFSNINSATSTLSGLTPGTYTLRWTVSGPCQNGTDDMVINVQNISVAPNAGSGNVSYTTICAVPGTGSQVLTGSSLAAGETAVWSQTGGGVSPYPNVTFSPDNTGSTVTVNGMNGTFPYTFRYTKTNSDGCTAFRTHTVYRAPSIDNLSEPANLELACNDTFATFNVTFTDAVSITNTITRTGIRISGPAAVGTLAYDNISTAAAGIRTERWKVSAMTLPGTYVYRMEYRTACGSVFRDIAVTISRTPGLVNAGSDIILPCNTLTATPIGATTAPGSYVWTQISGPNTATVTGSATLTPNMSGLQMGVYAMRLNLSGGKNCPAKTDTMYVSVTTAVPTIATTGPNATICAGRYRLTANTPLPNETGTWTVSPSSGVSFLPNANTPNAIAAGLLSNTSYTFTWTVSNTCGSVNSAQTLVTTAASAPPLPDAGTNVCLATSATSTTISGNDAAGATITWTPLTAGSSVVNAASRNTQANFTGGPGTYLFEYQLSTAGCAPLADTLVVTINSTPYTAAAGADQDLCLPTLPGSVTLTGSPAAPTGATAQWAQLSGPNLATLNNATATTCDMGNLASGIYEFEYRITSGICATSADVVVLRIAQPPSVADAGADVSLCNATTATLAALSAVAPTSGTGYWQALSGPTGTTTPTISSALTTNTNVSNLTQGTYTMRWTVSTSPSCATSTDDVNISVVAQANAGADQNFCNSPSAALTGSANSSGTWSQVSGPAGATISSNGPNTAVVTGLAGASPSAVYTFRYTLPEVGSCLASTDDMLVTVYPAPSAADAGANVEVCTGVSSVTLTGNVPAFGTGSWVRVSGPNTPVAGANNGQYVDTLLTGLVAGAYLYQYEVKTHSSCVASIDQVYIYKEIAANAGTDAALCNVSTTSLTGSTPAINTGVWALVSGPNTPVIANANSPQTNLSGLIPGTYLFNWTIGSGGACGANTDEVQVRIDAPVTSADAGADVSSCQGSLAAFPIGSAAVGGLTYQWSPATLLSDPNIAQPNFTGVNNSGTFTYAVRVVNGTCEAIDEITIVMKPKPNVVIQTTAGICGATYTATDLGAGVALPVTYAWTFGTKPHSKPSFGNRCGTPCSGLYHFGPQNHHAYHYFCRWMCQYW
ncbi:PKD domain-containing protein [Phnomibacter ginsenosidimutans]|uniref:Gliding motility-associated C-terminal domain-containing protein n=1 Tax=Phnomibacter ginsenosidimutans TaxID=2676868 RepID=A0A6I6GK78_9BACT|nr:hypothetical protein [Phnomibacter ginsenosidimutans]QGW28018.1 hypothetical protein GLV81_07820 [Phnomibacter ginsenosidimutans]